MVPKPAERTACRVDTFEEPEWLLWCTPNRSWAWRLIPLPGGQTRLITRMKTLYEWRRPLVPVTVMLMECADYPMMRRMLRNIRDRAEAGKRTAARKTTATAVLPALRVARGLVVVRVGYRMCESTRSDAGISA